MQEAFADRSEGTSQDMLLKITFMQLLFHVVVRFVALTMEAVDFSEILGDYAALFLFSETSSSSL